MKYSLFHLLFLLTIIQVQLILPPEKREELLNKLAKKISPSDLDKNIFDYEEYFYEESFQQMKYNVSDIQALMAKYNLPENYNYLNESNATINIKDQENCGCCWSFSATSALAYRYKKLGLDISLSPQDGLSCYLRDCDMGNNLIDPQLNLVKNGTVTEKCFPFVSGNGKTIPQCPTQCEDGSEIKKYYSQNAYQVDNNDQNNFYELVILIMDQLVTKGPISGGFMVYADFFAFGDNKQKCLNDVYTYDGLSEVAGGHAITIVGYGLLNNKFYWIIQNSWGSEWCDNGFIKMEIGQLFEVSFSEPNLLPEQVEPIEIDVNLKKVDLDCNLVIETSSSLDKWINTLGVKYVLEESKDEIDFQIGKNKIIGKNEINCFYEQNKLYNYKKKGKYIFKEFESFGKENSFKLNSFDKISFDFYGFDTISPLIYKQYYVSQKGSKILFQHLYKGDDDSLPTIYKDLYLNYPLKNCHHLKTSTKLSVDLAYCEITQDDLNYLNTKDSVNVYYNILCGYLYSTNIILAKLDLDNYPFFKIYQFLKPNDDILTKNSELIIVSSVTGNTQYFQNKGKYFKVLMEIENNEQNQTVLASCGALVTRSDRKTNLTCLLDITSANYTYQNIYLLPYFVMSETNQPFDVIIDKTIKAGEEEPDPTDSDSTEPTDSDSTEPTDSDSTEPDTTDKQLSSFLEYSLNLLFVIKLLLLLF